MRTSRIPCEPHANISRPPLLILAAACLALLAGRLQPAAAWDAEGHRIVTRIAFQSLPPTMPDWLRTTTVRDRLEYLANEPDRWRGQRNIHIDHANLPEHYLDLETLADFDLTIRTLPPLRRQFTDHIAGLRAKNPERFGPAQSPRDRAYVYQTPGLLPYAIAEGQWKLAASWTTLKTYELFPEAVTADEWDNARQNIVYQMGVLSHYVGDGAQPLHTTKHHHGWVGPNPKGYTRQGSIHAYIDGGVLRRHGLTLEVYTDLKTTPRAVSVADCWRDICDYLDQGNRLVEPLYALHLSGELDRETGREFIDARLRAGGAMLAGIWTAACEGAVIDEFRADELQARLREKAGKSDLKKSNDSEKKAAAAESQPASTRAESQPSKDWGLIIP